MVKKKKTNPFFHKCHPIPLQKALVWHLLLLLLWLLLFVLEPLPILLLLQLLLVFPLGVSCLPGLNSIWHPLAPLAFCPAGKGLAFSWLQQSFLQQKHKLIFGFNFLLRSSSRSFHEGNILFFHSDPSVWSLICRQSCTHVRIVNDWKETCGKFPASETMMSWFGWGKW